MPGDVRLRLNARHRLRTGDTARSISGQQKTRPPGVTQATSLQHETRIACYWIGVPPPPGAICASVVGVALFVKKIVPAALVAKLRFPVVPCVTGTDVP